MTPRAQAFTPRVQVFVYPEELLYTAPEALAGTIARLGCDAASMSLVYHRARRVFPRHGSVSVLTTNGIYFTPDPRRYGRIVPGATAPRELQAKVRRFRESCADNGLGFRAWVVGLHDESLAREWPQTASQTVDGSWLGHGLCPSAPESIEYVAGLAGDIASQLEPECIDLEAWLYPAWEPAYTLTQALQPLSPDAELLATQCFCGSCRSLLGSAWEELALRAQRLASSARGLEQEPDETLHDELAARRAEGAGRVATAVAEVLRGQGVSLRLLCSGAPQQVRLQGLSGQSASPADAIQLGCGRLRGSELLARFRQLLELVRGSRQPIGASTNWTPERTPRAMARDVKALASLGARGLSLYNLSLVPEEGLVAFRAATAAFRKANSAQS